MSKTRSCFFYWGLRKALTFKENVLGILVIKAAGGGGPRPRASIKYTDFYGEMRPGNRLRKSILYNCLFVTAIYPKYVVTERGFHILISPGAPGTINPDWLVG